VREVNFDNPGDDITVYPVPAADGKLFIASSANAVSAILYDAAGKWVQTFILNGTNNALDISGVSKGIYQLKVITQNSIYTGKIIIR